MLSQSKSDIHLFSFYWIFFPLFWFLTDRLLALSLAVGKGWDLEFHVHRAVEFLSHRGNLAVLEGQFMDGGKFRLSPALGCWEANLPPGLLGFLAFYSDPFPVSLPSCCPRKFDEMIGSASHFSSLEAWASGQCGCGRGCVGGVERGGQWGFHGHMCKIDPLIPWDLDLG